MIPSDPAEIEAEQLKLLVADTLAAVLRDTGVSRSELADRVGKSAAWISQALSGDQNLTLESIATLAEAIGARWTPLLSRIRQHPECERLPMWVREERELTAAIGVGTQRIPINFGSRVNSQHHFSIASPASRQDSRDLVWVPAGRAARISHVKTTQRAEA